MSLSREKEELLALLLAEEGLELEPDRTIRPLENRENLPLSYAQQRLWFLYQLQPDDPSYNITTNVRLQGVLRVDILQRCFNEVVQRHEALRTRFVNRNGQPQMVIDVELHVDLPLVDLTGLPTEERGDEVTRLFRAEARKPFDLSQDPMIRTTLLRAADDEHVLLLTLHHIVSDGWSMGVFLQEVGLLYEAFLQGKPSPLPDLPIQYADYAHWQIETLQGDVLEDHLSFWRSLLEGELPVLELPTDRPRPKVKSGKGHLKKFPIPARVIESLTEIGARQEASLYQTLLTAFNVLLHRYTGQEDILVGAPIANRNRREVEGLIGFLANTVVFRTDLSGEPTFRELLTRVRNVANGVYAHQDLPFVKLVEAIQPDRNLGNTPLFQVFFVLQNAPMPELELSGLTLSLMEMESATAKFDLSFYIMEEGSGQVGLLEYNTDLYDHETIDRMIRHFLTLLEGIAADPDHKVSELPLLPADEHGILRLFSQGKQTGVEQVCIHELFEAQAARTPDATALVFEGEELTYAALNGRANQLAHRLQQSGIGPEALVGLTLERSVEMVVALLGVLKAGGAYLPLDPHAPAERLQFILEETGLTVLLTQARFADRVPQGANVEVLVLDKLDLSQESGENAESGVTSDNMAYIIYTSGSTGRPKGVMVPHLGVSNRLLWGQMHDPLTGEDRVLQKTPYTFDVSVWEFFWPLTTGATLVVAKPDGHQDPFYLKQLIQEQSITTTHFVPSMLQIFLEEKGVGDCVSLRRVICSGEALPYDLQERFFSKLNASLHNFYGPTEASIEVTYWICQPDSPRRTVPIGHPIANVETHVLDRNLRPVPIGVPGELYLGGACVTRGYYNRPELTEQAFVPHPFSANPEERLYKTGDLVRFLADGAIEYLGRLDHQVKIRGFRIELGEIEAALLQQDAVRDAVVVAREDVPGEKLLVAYLVPPQDRQLPSLAELRRTLLEKLPAYMVPSFFVPLEALPLTSSGKTDRKALPAPGQMRPTLERAYVAPRNAQEAQLAELWKDLLGVEQVGALDNFFELGGHSLKATQLIAQVNDAYAVDIKLSLLFEEPTVAGLSRLIADAGGSAPKADESAILPLARKEGINDFPASFAQQRLWFFDQLMPGIAAYNVPNLIRLNGRLDVHALERTIAEIISRHEALRTTVVRVNGQVVQRIGPMKDYRLPFVDLLALPRHEREAEAYRLAFQEAQTGFDLEQGPLFRAELYRLRDEEHWLMLNLHHIITDGWSMGLLFQELAALYHAFSQGKSSPLSELTLQYADYARWHSTWLQGDVLAEQMAYWKGQLAGELPVLQLPTDRPRPAVQTYNGRTHIFRISPELTEQLRDMSQAEGATLFMTLLAAYNTLLSRYTGQDDILIGSPIAARTRSEMKDIFGLFVNTLVLRTDLSGNPTFRELLARTKGMALDAFAHQDAPLDRLVEELQPERNLSHAPLFQAMFVLQNAPLEYLELNELTLTYMEPDTENANFDLSLSMKEYQGGLYGKLNYNTDLFDASTIERLVGHFEILLQGIASAADSRLSDLPLLPEGEERQLLLDWNAPLGDYPQDVTAHALFERQAERTPNALAVQAGDVRLTYRELNERANSLAHYLQSRGVGPEGLVTLCIERSTDLVVGVLGILKAGAAYVPLDTAYPEERIALILEDTAAPLLVTQSHLLPSLPLQHVQAVCLDTDWSAIAEHPQTNPISDVQAHNVAYMIYTSGSTGRPKAVMVEHRNLVATLLASQDDFAFEPETVMPWIASVAFDIALFELMNPLLAGGTVVVLTRDEVLDLNGFARHVQRFTMMHAVPSLMRSLLQTIRELELPLELFDGMRDLYVGGDAVPPDLLTEMASVFREADIHILYGPTEGTIICSHYLVPEAGMPERFLIGTRMNQAELRVYDAHGSLAPLGVPGELWIGGLGVTRGYFRRDDLTADRFVERDGRRWYRSGDLVRYLPDGTLEFLGRLDNQVKIRGFRIELGEIQTLLSGHPDVAEAIVLVREQAGDKHLIGYFVPESGATLSTHELRDFLKGRLPDYMIPSHLLALDEMPLNPNGKIDRKALRQPEAHLHDSSAYVAPRNALEAGIAALLGEVLHREQIGIHDNFFELGGHSLLATQLVSRLNARFSIRLSLRSFFERPTIAGLADIVQSLQQQGGGAEAPILAAEANADAHRPLSFAQQRLWLLEQLDPGTPLYNMPVAARLNGEVQLSVLKAAVGEIIRRHHALRTVFSEAEGEAVQIVLPQTEAPLLLIDISSLPAAEREAELERLVREESETPFDLQCGPLIRLLLVRLEQEEHFLLLNTHHIVSDGWSTGVFFREVATLYAAFAAGQPSPLPDLQLQYADYAAWQREQLQGELLNAQLDYWRDQLAEAAHQPLRLPTDRPRPGIQSHYGATEYLDVPPQLAKELQAVSLRHGATLFMTLLAAYQTLLHGVSGQSSISVGTPVAGRSRTELEELIGFFVNTLVLRTDVGGARTFADLLQRVRDVSLGAFAHADVPFEKIVEVLQPTRDLSRSPLFQVMFALQNAPFDALELPGLSLTPQPLAASVAKFDLSLIAWENEQGGLTAALEYNTDLFDAATAKRLLHYYEQMLHTLVRSPEQPLSQLAALASDERKRSQADGEDAPELQLGGLLRDNAYVAPRDELEAELVTLWQELLHAPQVGVTDNFFHIGGHSLLAVRLLSRIRKQYDRDLPLATLFQEGTIEALAMRLRRDSAAQSRILIPIQPNGTQRPLFLFHAVGGNVFSYHELSRALGEDQPVYGLQALGLEGDAEQSASFEEMAVNYIREIRTLQPEGPYRLGGWSLGGVIAYEAARQLQEAGETVEWLGLIDSYLPQPGDLSTDEIEIAARFVHDTIGGYTLDLPNVSLDDLRRLTPEEALQRLLLLAEEHGLLPAQSDFETYSRLFRVFRANFLAFASYQPLPYRGDLMLYKATERLANTPDTDDTNGWDALADRVHASELPGNHYTLLAAPHADALARLLRTSL